MNLMRSNPHEAAARDAKAAPSVAETLARDAVAARLADACRRAGVSPGEATLAEDPAVRRDAEAVVGTGRRSEATWKLAMRKIATGGAS